MPTVDFTVPFVRGKQRPKAATRGGHPHVYTPARTLRDEATVRDAYEAAALETYGEEVRAPKGTPVTLRIDIRRHLPDARPRRITSEPDTVGGRGNPDLDNVVKLISDALNGAAWADDCQVDMIIARKHARTRRDGDETAIRVTWGEDTQTVDAAALEYEQRLENDEMRLFQ